MSIPWHNKNFLSLSRCIVNSRKCSKKFIYFLFNSLATRFSLQTWWLFQCHLIPAVVDWIQNLHLVRHRMKNTQKSQQFFNVKLFDFILICLFGWNRCCGGCACSSISSAARIFIISAKLTDCCRKSVWHPPDTCELMTQKSENLFTLSAYWGISIDADTQYVLHQDLTHISKMSLTTMCGRLQICEEFHSLGCLKFVKFKLCNVF